MSLAFDSSNDALMRVVLALAGTAALLWLAGRLVQSIDDRSPVTQWTLGAAAASLAACGLWWPSRALAVAGAVPAWSQVALLWGAGLVFAVLAAATAKLLHRRSLVGTAVMAALTLAFHAAAAFVAWPGVLQIGAVMGPIGLLALGVGLPAALVLALREQGAGLLFAGIRAAACGAAALLLVLVALPSQGTGDGAAVPFGLELPLLLLLCAFAMALLHLAPPAGEPGAEGHGRSKSRSERTDGLTGLPTRPRFERALSVAAKVATGGRHRLAVLFIDLDGFKPVNDTFGHTCGDRVLEEIGSRLLRLAQRDTVAARIGGDEFVLLMPRVGRTEEPAAMARRVIDALSQPVKVEGREIGISCSVGIAMFPDGCGPAKLIARADAAMYAAKRQGGSRLAFYSPEMDVNVEKNFDLVRDLRRAFKAHQLELWYQPKIDARSGKVTAAEALLRWRHPERGLLMPGEFIELAERFGLISTLGDWVILAACRQARHWRERGLRMRVAINLSAHQMRQADLADRIASALEHYRIDPSLLTCEITETAAMEDTQATQETFRRLGVLGVHLSIDDFGTGHSSLSYLRKLPAEELKIDRSFIVDLEHSDDARAVVDAVIKLSHALGLKVVAEGVENTRQQEILVTLGCDQLQGFLFAKPMSGRALLLAATGQSGGASTFQTSLFGETRERAEAHTAFAVNSAFLVEPLRNPDSETDQPRSEARKASQAAS